MAIERNPFGKPGQPHQAAVKFDMENAFGRHGAGMFYHAVLSFDPAIFEPGAAKDFKAACFQLRLVGFDEDDLEQIEALGVAKERWEAAAVAGLCGFAAMDAWLEESATDEQSAWLEESGWLDEIIDMEADFKELFSATALRAARG